MSLPTQLIRALKKKRCILFIGNEVSAEAGVISDAKLANRLLKQCDSSTSVYRDNLPLAAQEYEKRIGRAELFDEIIGHLPNKHASQPSHHIIKLIDYFDKIVTTNWDCLIETTLGITPVINNDNFAFRDDKGRNIFKIHGDLVNPKSMIVTEDDMRSIAIPDKQKEKMVDLTWEQIKNWANRHTLLFVGCDMDYPDIQYLVNECRRDEDKRRPTYFVSSKISPDQDKEFLKKDVKSIEMSPLEFFVDLWKSLPEIIARTAECVDREKPLEMQRNRIIEIRKRVDERKHAAFVGYFGFNGIGKSTLAKRIEMEYRNANIPCLNLAMDLELQLSKEDIITQLLATLDSSARKDLGDLRCEALKPFLNNRPAVLIFDGVEKLSAASHESIRSFLTEATALLQEKRLYVIATGISKASVDFRIDKEERLSEFVRLQPFTVFDTWEFINGLTRSVPPLSSVHKEIHEITRGHPGCIKLVIDELEKQGQIDKSGISKNAVTVHRGILLKNLKDKLLHEVFNKLKNAEKCAEICEAISPLVLPFDLGPVRQILNQVYGTEAKMATIMELLGDMEREIPVISTTQESRNFQLCECIRGIFVEYLKANDPKKHRQILTETEQYYRQRLHDVPSAFNVYATVLYRTYNMDSSNSKLEQKAVKELDNLLENNKIDLQETYGLRNFLKEDSILGEGVKERLKSAVYNRIKRMEGTGEN